MSFSRRIRLVCTGICVVLVLWMVADMHIKLMQTRHSESHQAASEILKNDGTGRTLSSVGTTQSRETLGVPNKEVNNKDTIMEQMRERNSGRKKIIQGYCDSHSWRNPLKRRDFNHVVVIEDHNILYCSTAKVASTTWRKVLGHLEGRIGKGFKPHGKGTFRLLSQYSNRDIKRKLASYKKFMFVREPFERLLSAFRDKFLSESSFRDKMVKKHSYFVEKYGRRIGRVTRALHEAFYTTAHAQNQDINVTFTDFVDYILHIGATRARFNEHWRPYHKLCHPCQVKYDFIGHYETLVEDAEFILKENGIHNLVTFPSWEPTNTSSLLLSYFKQVSLDKIRYLYTIYQDDFEMNHYSFPGQLSSLFQNSFALGSSQV